MADLPDNAYYSSQVGLDDMFDDEIIENVLSEEWCAKFYTSEAFKSHLMDFGGGVQGLHCRTIVALTNNSADTLLSFLGIRKSVSSKENAEEILAICNKALTTSAYII